ncbi:unnamed protein product [Boreogadus saida]
MNVEGCKRFVFGKDHFKQNRTIMVLGATGAGKSTMVNGMINYILGVTWDDTFRFKLVDEGTAKSQGHSQTSNVNVYKLNHREGFQIDCSLTIVDTPGFGDTRGIERDNMIMDQLKSLFSAKLGVSEIDAICFVAQASLARLTATQKYIFDSVLSIFGNDVAENIQILVTFADGQKSPVLEAINQAEVPCPKKPDRLPIHFKFNNSALFADNKVPVADNNADGIFEKMFWDMGTNNMKRLFSALNAINPKSLTLTNEVLKKRCELETAIENLQIKGKLGFAKLDGINEESKILQTHKADITANGKFDYNKSVALMKCWLQEAWTTGVSSFGDRSIPNPQDSSGRRNSFHGSSFLREECLSSFVYVEEIAGAIVEKNGEPLKHCHNVIRDVCCPGGQIN